MKTYLRLLRRLLTHDNPGEYSEADDHAYLGLQMGLVALVAIVVVANILLSK